MSDQFAPPPSRELSNPLKWPKIIGILAIVFAMFSFFGSIMSAFTGKLLRFQMGMNQAVYDVEPEAIDGFLSKWNWYFLTGGAAGLVMGLLLLLGGIFLLKGKKISRPLFLFYSVFTIIYSMFSVYIALDSGMVEEQMSVMFGIGEGESLADHPEANIGRISGIAGGIFGAVFALIPPVFLLIWFLRNQVKIDMQTHFS